MNDQRHLRVNSGSCFSLTPNGCLLWFTWCYFHKLLSFTYARKKNRWYDADITVAQYKWLIHKYASAFDLYS